MLGVSATLSFVAEGASISGSSNVHVYDITVKAYIDDWAAVYAGGNVYIAADSKTGVDLIAGNVAITGEGAGIGASAIVVTISKDVLAYVGENASVDAEANSSALTVADGNFEVVYNPEDDEQTDITAPDIDNADASDESIIRSRVSTPTTTTVKGIAITAINRDDIEMIAVGGAAGIVGAGIELSGAVAVVDTTTQAYIDNGANINTLVSNPSSEQSLLVAAGSDHYQMGVAGSLAIGAAGIGPGVHVTVLNYETKAFIDDSAIVYTEADILVRANTSEDILSISISAAGGGGTLSGAVSVLDINSVTYAYFGQGVSVDADGNIAIEATDITDIDVIAGAVSVNGGGLGASVAVTLIDKDTQAYIGANSTVNARGNSNATLTVPSGDANTSGSYKNTDGDYFTETIHGLSIQAYSAEDIFAISASGAYSGGGSIAGAVSVEVIDSDTLAFIGPMVVVNGTNNDGASSNQSINISARNDVDVFVVAGVAVLGGGLTGGVDVGIIKNDTSALIANGADVQAKLDIDINAISDRYVESYAISVSLGQIGIAGAVEVWSIGGNLDSDSIDSLQANDEDDTEDPDYSSIYEMVDTNSLLEYFTDLLTGYEEDTIDSATFDSASGVDSVDDTIDFGVEHDFTNGQAVAYSSDSGSDIGLTDGGIYYVIVIDSTTIQLAENRSDAMAFDPGRD